MAKVQRIVVHCTGDPSNASRCLEYYRKLFFITYNQKHWGYHAVVYQNGTYDILQPLPSVTADGGFITDATMANGAKGYNSSSLHIAYVGGLDPVSRLAHDTRTPEQRETLRVLIAKWKHQYQISEVVGHSQLPNVKKACPGFDARKEYENV